MSKENQLQYHGKLGNIYLISISNFLLKIITLGIYSPWAKTKMRKYLYGNISIFGYPIRYLGKGGEIFKSYIVVYLLLIICSLVLYAIIGFLAIIIFRHEGSLAKLFSDYAKNLWTILIVFFLGYYAAFAGLGYKISRTSWMGIRGKLNGSAKSYALFRFKRMFLNILSFGYLIGRTDILARKYKVERIVFGNENFKFNLDKKALDKINIITLIFAIPTLFLSRIYYKAQMLKMFWSATSIDQVRFSGKHSFASMLWLLVSNSLLLIFSLGIGIPFIIHRTAKYFANNIKIEGSIEGSNIIQKTNNLNDARGEALENLSYNDVGLNFDIGLW